MNRFKDKHKGDDIYVLGSGGTMNYIHQSFFDNKIVIGVNEIYRRFRCDYLVRKEYNGALEAYNTGVQLFISEYDCGGRGRKNPVFDNAVTFEHLPNEREVVLYEEGKIIVSFSTITSAFHIAAYMGAKNILVCGNDCLDICGKSNIDDYPNKTVIPYETFAPQTQMVKEILEKEYGCNIYGINPFVTAYDLKLKSNSFGEC